MFRYRTVKLRVRLSARQCHWCRRSTISVPPGRLTTAAGELAPFKQALDGPSLRSKRGVEDFRRTDNTHSVASKHRGAPTSPPWAAEILEALDTRLRQHQSNSTTVPARYRELQIPYERGPLTDRHAKFPGGWGVNRSQLYRRGPIHLEICCPRSRRRNMPPADLSGSPGRGLVTAIRGYRSDTR